MSTPDLTDFGTDIAGYGYISPVWGLASGLINLANAQLRRLTTPAGTLDDHPSYGYDVRDLLVGDFSPTDLDAARSAIESQCEDDERVQSCKATLTMSQDLLLISLDELTADGPFALVLAVGSVSAAILSINGVPVVSEDAGTTTTVVVGLQGPVGPAGPAGAGGGGGGGSVSLDLDGLGPYADSSGTEVILIQEPRDFGVLGGTVSVELTMQGKLVSAGTATFRVRIGGTTGNTDGATVATLTTTATSYASLSVSGTLSNPTGLPLVTVTMQSPAGIEADAQGIYVTLR